MEKRLVTTEEAEQEIDLLELFGVLVKRIWTIILVAIIAGAAVFGYTYVFVTPLYEASALMYVNNSDISIGSTSVSITSGQLTAAQQLVDTYVVILESRTTLEDVIEKANVDYTYDELKDMIEAAAVNSTEIFEIVVTSPDPYEAENIANTIAEILPDRIADVVSGSDVRIVDYAVVPAHRASPSYTRNTAIGVLAGAALSIAVIIIAYMLDEKIHTEDYLTHTYPDIPLLATIPDMSMAQKKEGYYAYRQSSEPKKTTRPRTAHPTAAREQTAKSASGDAKTSSGSARPSSGGARPSSGSARPSSGSARPTSGGVNVSAPARKEQKKG